MNAVAEIAPRPVLRLLSAAKRQSRLATLLATCVRVRRLRNAYPCDAGSTCDKMISLVGAMKRIGRAIFAALTPASALLCAGMIALWLSDYHEIAFRTSSGRYAVCSAAGGLHLIGPPRATAVDLSPEAREAASRLNNLDIDWPRGQPIAGTPAAALEAMGSPVLTLRQFRRFG